MPFKTRRQKQAARDRRMVFAKNSLITYKSPNVNKDSRQGKRDSELAVSTVSTRVISDDYPFIRKDLLKIAVLCLVIIGTQIILRLVQHKFSTVL